MLSLSSNSSSNKAAITKSCRLLDQIASSKPYSCGAAAFSRSDWRALIFRGGRK
nr:MAG TPA: hypothetical protein [Caudoviricetes sp.]